MPLLSNYASREASTPGSRSAVRISRSPRVKPAACRAGPLAGATRVLMTICRHSGLPHASYPSAFVVKSNATALLKKARNARTRPAHDSEDSRQTAEPHTRATPGTAVRLQSTSCTMASVMSDDELDLMADVMNRVDNAIDRLEPAGEPLLRASHPRNSQGRASQCGRAERPLTVVQCRFRHRGLPGRDDLHDTQHACDRRRPRSRVARHDPERVSYTTSRNPQPDPCSSISSRPGARSARSAPITW